MPKRPTAVKSETVNKFKLPFFHTKDNVQDYPTKAPQRRTSRKIDDYEKDEENGCHDEKLKMTNE